MGIGAVVLDSGDEEECSGGGRGGGGRRVLVGMKMEEESRGLLTWSLMKAARPGDLVVAVHVVTPNDQSSDAMGTYSLFSLVKAFDSVLAAYEGFCDLKQVELKLKICRGSSVQKVLLHEANGLIADMVVVGTSGTRSNTVWRLNSVANYLARKLPKECSVLAIKNGKAVFQREATPRSTKGKQFSLTDLLSSKMPRVANERIISNSGYKDDRKCCSCRMSCFPDASCPTILNEHFPDDEHEPEASPSAVVPTADTLEAENKPGWPLLRRSIYLSSVAAGLSFSNDSFRILPDELERLKDKYSST